MRELTTEERRAIAQFMRNRRRQQRAPNPRRYPKSATLGTKTYIDDFNAINANHYQKRITLDYTCANT